MNFKKMKGGGGKEQRLNSDQRQLESLIMRWGKFPGGLSRDIRDIDRMSTVDRIKRDAVGRTKFEDEVA